MFPAREVRKYALISCAAALLAACTSDREPAEKLMQNIDITVNASAAEAAKYVPGELNDVQTKYDDLKTSLNAQDYKRVLAQGPALLTEAQGLAGAAAAKKAELVKQLNDQWAALSTAVPGEMGAIQSRLDKLAKNRKQAAGIDLNAAKSSLSDATSLWSKAQGAFGNGNLDEAVTAAKNVKTALDGVAANLKLDLPAAGAAAPAAPPT
ncbi:MAG TPA: hypothetical protein VK437_11530 [Steroidobacteraceae bacterium]|nr:hypothetical protein [Steroidobacteraceae bacterium]